LLKSWLGAFPNKIPKKAALVYGFSNKKFLEKTSKNLKNLGIDVFSLEEAQVQKTTQIRKEKAIQLINNGEIDILITDNYLKNIDYDLRRIAADLNLPLVLNARLGYFLSKAFKEKELQILEMKKYW
jgi:carbamoyl-phosphate synthase large subunit